MGWVNWRVAVGLENISVPSVILYYPEFALKLDYSSEHDDILFLFDVLLLMSFAI